MVDRLSWFGTPDALLNFLRVVQADRDEDGDFLVAPLGTIAIGMDGSVIVGPDAVYFIAGEPRALAHGLSGTSHGMSIVAFGVEPAPKEEGVAR